MTLEEAIEHLDEVLTDNTRDWCEGCRKEHERLREWMIELRSRRGITMAENCEYCHEDSELGVKPLDKNARAFLYPTMGRWGLHIIVKRRNLVMPVEINYCPMCGRRLNNG